MKKKKHMELKCTTKNMEYKKYEEYVILSKEKSVLPSGSTFRVIFILQCQYFIGYVH